MPWSQSGNIKGASGQPGASGASGLQGASGVPGVTGPTGASGPAGTTTWSGITDKPAVIAAGVDAAAARNVISAEYTGNKGVANGYAALDSSGLVPSSQLPSFVDDVVEAANLSAFPATGESGKIYTALDTNKVYRWGGSSYTEISPSPGSTDAVPEGSTNLYYTAARADGRITAAVGSTVQAYSATLTSYAGKTAPSGAVVGTTDSQTLTNKTISGANNTVTNLGVASLGASGTPSSSTFLRGDSSWASVPSRNISTITSSQTLGSASLTDYYVFCSATAGDVNYSTTTAVLHFDGANNSTTITDNSAIATSWTCAGDAKLTTAQSRFGTASLSLDGTGDYIFPTAANSNFAWGSSDFTIELWARATSVGTSLRFLYEGRHNVVNTTAPTIYLDASGILQYYASGSNRISDNVAFPTNTWTHVAVSRVSGTTRMFKNGTQVGSNYSDSITYTVGEANLPLIGAAYADSAKGAFSFTGQIDDVRLSKFGRYAANFTAPSSAFPDVASVAATPTLPTAVGSTNLYTIKNISGTSITIGVTSSQQIDGSSGGLSLTNGSTAQLISDGSNWRTV